MVNNMKKTLIISALTVMACQAFAQGKLTGFSVRPLGEGFEVQVKGEDLGEPKQIRVMGNKSLMLEFDASLSGKPETFRFNKHGLTFVQSTWYSRRIRCSTSVHPNHLRLRAKRGSRFAFGFSRSRELRWLATQQQHFGPSPCD